MYFITTSNIQMIDARFFSAGQFARIQNLASGYKWPASIDRQASTTTYLPSFGFRNPWLDYIAPIILLRAPNLKHLVVHGPYNPSIFEEFSMKAVLRNRALPQKLESLSVGQQEISCLWHLELRVRTDLDALGGFLMRLENLETLSISRPNLKRLPEKLPLQKLRRLRIGNACLSKDTLQRLINSTGSLEEFVYREIGDTAESTVTRLVTSQEIFEMLIPMKDRLREESLMLLLSKRTVAYQPVNGVGLFNKASMRPSLFENAYKR
ncbi:uncharacterized protein FOBCDRAFT_198234 [Fusarium oxysporum Fo47]|uniref:uncharacterized protein n=1 Tax=Fusarium oxysporum Fo47 TaxID=660027 RepID=UPI002869AA29|nr:uncharacterized protein FOBCDRAFT_198234 [Fusarium oxysporum Fo47]WJG34932.1 hypothetical protein FOBCDRAFT_198234 [Fusarium oxysporum Fo47]